MRKAIVDGLQLTGRLQNGRSAETDASEPSSEAGFQTIELRNKRLRLPLTRAALQRLNALVKRWSLVFGSSELAAVQDLEPPDPEDQPDLQHSSRGILGGLDENAFGTSRCFTSMPL